MVGILVALMEVGVVVDVVSVDGMVEWWPGVEFNVSLW